MISDQLFIGSSKSLRPASRNGRLNCCRRVGGGVASLQKWVQRALQPDIFGVHRDFPASLEELLSGIEDMESNAALYSFGDKQAYFRFDKLSFCVSLSPVSGQ